MKPTTISKKALQQKIDQKTKPLGALGTLEQLAFQIGQLQNSLSPSLNKPSLLVFAADHGIAQEGTSAFPPVVTQQMVLNFLAGGAAINVFCRQHGITLKVVDAGVNADFEAHPNLIDAKAARGSKSFLKQAAMSQEELQFCMEKSRDIILALHEEGCNVVGFGEMGIGNTSAAALLMSNICQLPIEDCVGRGTGLDDAQLQHKINILSQVKAFHGQIDDPEEALRCLGGLEIAQICGAMLTAYKQDMLILVDGFIASSAFLVAHAIQPHILKNAVFCHLSDEQGHLRLLNHLGATPLLRLQMRLGEGTGCAVAYPIVESAVRFLNEMASFESAGVSDKTA